VQNRDSFMELDVLARPFGLLKHSALARIRRVWFSVQYYCGRCIARDRFFRGTVQYSFWSFVMVTFVSLLSKRISRNRAD
jgi:hypothetical protein